MLLETQKAAFSRFFVRKGVGKQKIQTKIGRFLSGWKKRKREICCEFSKNWLCLGPFLLGSDHNEEKSQFAVRVR